MPTARTSLEHGSSRITWVYRNQSRLPLADGTGRAGLVHRLLPFRRLTPGRYDLQFARYGRAWPVTLRPDPAAEDDRMMIAEGRVPL